MRAILISAVAAATLLAGCDQMNGTNASADTDAVVVADAATGSTAVTTPATEPTTIAAGDTAPLPMLGSWACGAGTTGFTITPGTFTTRGGSATRIASIDRLAVTDYRLTLSDSKKIRLTDIVDGKLTYQHENAEGGAEKTTASCTKQM